MSNSGLTSIGVAGGSAINRYANNRYGGWNSDTNAGNQFFGGNNASSGLDSFMTRFRGFQDDQDLRFRNNSDYFQRRSQEQQKFQFGLGQEGADKELGRTKDLGSFQEGVDTRAREQTNTQAVQRMGLQNQYQSESDIRGEGIRSRLNQQQSDLTRGQMQLSSQLAQSGKDSDLKRALSILPR